MAMKTINADKLARLTLKLEMRTAAYLRALDNGWEEVGECEIRMIETSREIQEMHK